MTGFCKSLTRYTRRRTLEVTIGSVKIGGDNAVAVQSMTNTDTNDTAACTEQIERICVAGGRIVRLTAQGPREGRNLENIAAEVRRRDIDAALVADIHFLPEVADIAAEHVDKVRINPGNYRNDKGQFEALLDKCRRRGVSLRIGVNHGSLSKRIFDRWGDTPEGMVASAMEFLEICRRENFTQVVVSMKSSNTRVMLHAYRLLAKAMNEAGMEYPLHLGVTEAGNDLEGRIKSAAGIGALMADGLGDTIRVSLTEAPENEIPIAQMLADYFEGREGHESIVDIKDASIYSPYAYTRRESRAVGRIGGGRQPVIFGELTAGERAATETGEVAILTPRTSNAPAEWRAAVLNMTADGDMRPVILRKEYATDDIVELAVKAAADLSMPLLDGLADGIDIRCEGVAQEKLDEIGLMILQATRARFSRTEYIACPSCGRTLYDIEETLARIKASTSHLKGLKIGVMGCIVNGPGEMADADYGYVGAAAGRITLYKGREIVRRNIPQHEAIEALIEIIKENGDWVDPATKE